MAPSAPASERLTWPRGILAGLLVQTVGLLLIVSALNATDDAGQQHVGGGCFVLGGLLPSVGWLAISRTGRRRST